MDSGLEGNDPLMNENLFEFDILLPKGTSPRTKITEAVKLWPGGIVPYVISEEFDSITQDKIKKAIKEFNYKTCIKFVPKHRSDDDYVVFVISNTDTCYVKHIGKSLKGGPQNINMAPSCQNGPKSKAIIQHEMMHTLGNVYVVMREEIIFLLMIKLFVAHFRILA